MTRYEITIEGTVGPVVASAMEGFAVEPTAHGRSLLVGEVSDQAALYGFLDRLHDLHVEIFALRRLEVS